MRISDWSSDVCSSDLLAFQSREMLGVGQSPPVERHRGARPWMRIDAGRQVDPVAAAKFTLPGLTAPAVPGPAMAHARFAHSSAAAAGRASGRETVCASVDNSVVALS